MAKLPSTRFPFINLKKALERAEKAFNADKGGKGLSIPVLFSAWGYSDKSSGGFQTVGALRGYGLLVGDNSKEAKLIRLTDDARHYFQTEIEADRKTLAAKFAAAPALFAHLLDHWDHGTVEDAVARTYLKTALGLNDQSARAALGIYKDNLSFASGKGSSKVGGVAPDEEGDAGDADEEGAVQQQQHTPAPSPPRAPAAIPVAGPGLNVMRAADGYVIHLAGSVMTKAHADEVITLLTALKGTLPDGTAPEPSDTQ